MADAVGYACEGGVARITLDDGKVNVMSIPTLEALHAAFDRAERDRLPVLLSARGRAFSAGFDLKALRGGEAVTVHRILNLGAELALRVLSFPGPVVAAVQGAAYPMGAFLVLGADLRLSATGDHPIGLNEMRIGLVTPRFAIEMARQRLSPAHFNRTVCLGEMFPPEEALRAGFYDRLVAPEALEAEAMAAARDLAALDFDALAVVKRRARGAAIDAVRAAIDEDLTLAAVREREQALARVRAKAAA